MRGPTVVLMAGLAIGCAGEPTGPEPGPPAAAVTAALAGSWAARAQYPVDVFDATSASITNSSTGRTTVYVVGGFPACCGAGRITDAVRAYDATANTWRARAHYPVRVHATNGAVALGGRIYVTGGFTRRWDAAFGVWRRETLNRLYVYNPNTDRWTRKRDMPVTSANGSSVGWQGKLYVAEGSVVWRYDPATDQWTQFATQPQRDWWNVSAGVIGGRLYLVEEFGGAMDILELATGAWSSGPNRPYRACNTTATDFRARLYLFGFCDDYPIDPETRDRGLVFDPAANAWSEATPAPIAVSADAAIARVFVNQEPRLSLVHGVRPNNHYLFTP
jgi:N-acetylneuraminic acid mutarotase